MFHKAIISVVESFEDLGIPYAIGGSVASGVRGLIRATNDVDFVAAISKSHVRPLIHRLGAEFYADEEYMRTSIGLARSFNLIHIPTAFKIDVFPAVEEFHNQQLQRATLSTFDFFGEKITSRVVAAEDVLLAKLRWYRLGGESSERQWNDIAGVISVSFGTLDHAYLERWAVKLSVGDLLNRAIATRQDER
jgi:hypothetical protein